MDDKQMEAARKRNRISGLQWLNDYPPDIDEQIVRGSALDYGYTAGWNDRGAANEWVRGEIMRANACLSPSAGQAEIKACADILSDLENKLLAPYQPAPNGSTEGE